jgi:hypothetical protein
MLSGLREARLALDVQTDRAALVARSGLLELYQVKDARGESSVTLLPAFVSTASISCAVLTQSCY